MEKYKGSLRDEEVAGPKQVTRKQDVLLLRLPFPFPCQALRFSLRPCLGLLLFT